MPFVISCPCGKKMRVPDDYAGKRVKCPGCGKGVLATAPDDDEPIEAEEAKRQEPKSRIRKELPPAKKAAARLSRDEDEDEEDDRPRRRAARVDDEDDRGSVKARKRAPSRKKQSSAKWPLIAACVALLLLLGGGGFAGYWFLFRSGENMSEQALIPPDGMLFMTVKVQELTKTEVYRKAIQATGEEDPFGPASAELGMTVADFDRMTMIMADAEQNHPWFIISTTRPYDRKAVLKDLQNVQTVKHENKSFHVGTTTHRATPRRPQSTDRIAVFFAGPKVVMMTKDEASMKKALTMAVRKSATGPLADAIKQIGGQRHLYGAFALPPRAQEELRKNRAQLPPPMNVAGPLLELQGGTVAMDFGDKIVVDANLKYRSEAEAKAAKGAFDTAKGTAALALLPMVPDKGAQDALRDALSSLKGEPSGAELVVKLEVATKALEGAIPQQPMMPGGGPPIPRK